MGLRGVTLSGQLISSLPCPGCLNERKRNEKAVLEHPMWLQGALPEGAEQARRTATLHHQSGRDTPCHLCSETPRWSSLQLMSADSCALGKAFPVDRPPPHKA